jgi:hypothetical protein
MKFRKLRIAWSVVCGIACLLLIALLVRSFRSTDAIHGDLCGHYLILCSSGDNFFVVAHTIPPGGIPNIWRYTQPPVTNLRPQITWFNFAMHANPVTLSFPQWIPIALTATLAVIPWARLGRFSLRTLLIATTLIAVVLRLTVWAVSP